jgi:ribosome-associated toxin RatA of RatAB toxin-antitoxin module
MSQPFELGPMPTRRRMRTVDERVVYAPLDRMFDLVRAVEQWPAHLRHYRSVRVHDRRADGGGVVTMAASRPFGPLRWPVWWAADMQVISDGPRAATIRFRHVAGITRGMEVEWSFTPCAASFAPPPGAVATFVRIVHQWDGPRWPLVGGVAATHVIGPVFIHGIASRTLSGLAAVAERASGGCARPADDERRATSRETNVGTSV